MRGSGTPAEPSASADLLLRPHEENMAKYQNEYRQDIGETEINESVMQQAPVEPEPTDPEEATFKKRYGDLRRHMQ